MYFKQRNQEIHPDMKDFMDGTYAIQIRNAQASMKSRCILNK